MEVKLMLSGVFEGHLGSVDLSLFERISSKQTSNHDTTDDKKSKRIICITFPIDVV